MSHGDGYLEHLGDELDERRAPSLQIRAGPAKKIPVKYAKISRNMPKLWPNFPKFQSEFRTHLASRGSRHRIAASRCQGRFRTTRSRLQ